MSKSQKIRDYLAANPAATASDVRAALKKEQIKVSMPLIYQQLSKSSKPAKTKNSNGAVSMASLLEAKKLVSEAGSMAEAEKALDLLAKLSS